MTLDRCVQRLRRRLASGSHSVAPKQKSGLDRTPSFYTSRSIINLSGLSVADPLPDVAPLGKHYSGFGLGNVNSPYQHSGTSSKSNSAGSLVEQADLWGSTVGSDVQLPNDDLRGGRFSSNSLESDKESGVCKTTTMARFYYRAGARSNSSQEDQLALFGSQEITQETENSKPVSGSA